MSFCLFVYLFVIFISECYILDYTQDKDPHLISEHCSSNSFLHNTQPLCPGPLHIPNPPLRVSNHQDSDLEPGGTWSPFLHSGSQNPSLSPVCCIYLNNLNSPPRASYVLIHVSVQPIGKRQELPSTPDFNLGL